jgi:hypothetical protein
MKHEAFDMDTTRYWDRGLRLMVETTEADDRRKPIDAVWALLCEAVAVSAQFGAPPRTGYPAKSAMPDAPDEVSYWARQIEAFTQKTTMHALYGSRPRPQFSAQQISDAHFTLWLFHKFALHGRRDRVSLLSVVHNYAGGMPARRIREATGISRWTLHRRKDQACEDMLAGLRKLALA